MTITHPTILMGHYCAARYPEHVGLGLPDNLDEMTSTEVAEICVARALGARDMEREHPGLRGAGEVAEMVAGLLQAPQAVPQASRCRACLGQAASELVASREAVRRLWCHVQAVNPAGLDRQSALVFAELRREVEALARVAGVA